MAKSGQWSEDTVVPKEKITVGRIEGTWKGGLVADRVNRIADGGKGKRGQDRYIPKRYITMIAGYSLTHKT